MLSALKDLIILGNETKTLEMGDNITQWVLNWIATQEIKTRRRSMIAGRATEGWETPVCYWDS